MNLAGRTTFRIGGDAPFLIAPRDVRSFAEAYAAACRSGMPVHILGMGSNILVSDDGVSGVVISTRGLSAREVTDDGQTVRVEAGAGLPQLVSWTCGAGLKGLEDLAGIPGTVGGAVVMNAGTAKAEVCDCVSAVWCVDASGKVYCRDRSAIAWGYRRTDIKDPVVRVEFSLAREEADDLLDRMAESLLARHRMQPVRVASAGCFFRNPENDSAGRLIDAAGLKGFRVGEAMVSSRHANFIVNRGGAKAAHVLELCKIVRERVQSRFGVSLKNEVQFWPTA